MTKIIQMPVPSKSAPETKPKGPPKVINMEDWRRKILVKKILERTPSY